MNLYGFFITLGIIIGAFVADRLNKKYRVSSIEYQISVFDILPWVLIPGIIGARLYHVIDYWSYYSKTPIEIFKIWNGGMGIYGGLIGGIVGLILFSKTLNLSISQSLSLLDLSAIALPIAQSIGRLGNYFNQELFGLPTNLPWGIYISMDKRPMGFMNYEYFHPLFFYESIGCLIIFIVLLGFLSCSFRSGIENDSRSRSGKTGTVFFLYLFLYSLLRFFLEFLRIRSWTIGQIRVNQLVSAIFILISLLFFAKKCYNHKNTKK